MNYFLGKKWFIIFLVLVFDFSICFLFNICLFFMELKCCIVYIGKCYVKLWEDNIDLECGLEYDVLEEFDGSLWWY